MTPPSIVFLDIDGVLNSQDWYDTYTLTGRRIPHPPFDPVAVKRLDRLVRETDAYVVLSSSWRAYPEIPRWLSERGFRGVICGRTPGLRHRYGRDIIRGQEIAWWLRNRALEGIPVRQWVILDDDDDMGDMTSWLVQTNHVYGLQDEDVERAKTILARGPGWQSRS
jgi:hypothetical protein